MDLTPDNIPDATTTVDQGKVFKYRSLGDGAAIALVRPAGQQKKVWRYRDWGETRDYPASAFSSLDEFHQEVT